MVNIKIMSGSGKRIFRIFSGNLFPDEFFDCALLGTLAPEPADDVYIRLAIPIKSTLKDFGLEEHPIKVV